VFILVFFHVTGELQESQHGDVQVLGDGLRPRVISETSMVRFLPGLEGVGAAQELQIVGDQQSDAVLALHAPCTGADRVDRQIGSMYNGTLVCCIQALIHRNKEMERAQRVANQLQVRLSSISAPKSPCSALRLCGRARSTGSSSRAADGLIRLPVTL